MSKPSTTKNININSAHNILFTVVITNTLNMKTKTENELVAILTDMYNNAPINEKVVNIHLFGIKYGDIIISNHYNVKDIIKASNLPESYSTELSKSVKLSKFVTIK